MATPPATPFPELREAEAPPEIAAIYAALRRATGVPLVNLIWRHLATMPGVLPWAWAAVRPPLEDGRLAAARARLAAGLALPPPGLATVDAAAWRAAGLAEADRAPVLAILAAYNRGNLTNLVLLSALLRAVEGGGAPASPPPGAAAAAASQPPGAAAAAPPMPAGVPVPPGPPPAGDDLPPLPVLATLPPPTRALVEGLAARHAPAEERGGVVPSLYLHFAHWPALLAALPGWAGTLLSDREVLAASRAGAVAAAAVEAEGMALGPVGDVPGGHAPAVVAALRRFTGQVIPEMVPVGLLLGRILAPPPSA